MSDPFSYEYPSPLEGIDTSIALPDELNEDGKSFKNPPAKQLSESYNRFTNGISNGHRGGFDVHIYYFANDEAQTKFAKELWERIRREFPELRIYDLWDKPIGPHPMAMFEVNLFTPAQFGAFIPWLVINRGPLSALLHPNTGEGDDESEEYRNHTQRATWLGQAVPLKTDILTKAASLTVLLILIRRCVESKAREENASAADDAAKAGKVPANAYK